MEEFVKKYLKDSENTRTTILCSDNFKLNSLDFPILDEHQASLFFSHP